MTLTVLRNTGQVFCKMSLNWDLSDDFLIVGLGDVFGEGGHRHEVATFSCSVEGRYCQHDLVWR